MTTQTSNDFTPVFIDFETPHDKTFSLSKLATVLYVRNPLFKVFGVGIAIGDQPIRWFTGEKIQSALETIDWNHSMMVAHNAMFEATVLNEHFGIQPARYCDTAGMARAYLPTGIRADLDSAASAFGLGTKIKGVLESLKGVFDPNPEQLDNLGTYCKEDVRLCRDLFNLLWPHLPETERYVLHMTVRMSSESRFELDQDILRAEIANAKQNRVDTIDASGSDLDALSSNQQFAETLRQLTGSCPVKYNKNGQEIPALSKSDAEYVRFKTDHPDLLPLFDAREAAKSTIMLRRPERYLEIAQTGRMPMPYRYWGAHTGRFSGADGLNVQNLPNLHKSDLRRAFKAPPGYVVHVADSSQIELRIQLWFSDALVLLNRLARGDDIYSEQATQVYGEPVTKADKLRRGVGKALELMGQYGAGHLRYRSYLAGGPLGLPPIFITEEEAYHSIHGVYRAGHPETVATWRFLDVRLRDMLNPDCHFEYKGITFLHERILLPNGMFIDYTGLRVTEDDQLVYGVNGVAKNIWGGTTLENICQALARIVVTDQAVEIDKHVIPVVAWTHDENLAIGPEDRADENQEAMFQIMKTSPAWAPDLPLDAEGGYDRSYSK